MAFNSFDSLSQIIDEIVENERKEEELEGNAEKIMINKIKVKSHKLIESKTFDSIEKVFEFSIDCQLNYETSKPFPKLDLPENRLKLNIDLKEGWDECRERHNFIDNYLEYRDKKWSYFLESIKANDLITKYEPKFVSFGGPVADMMATNYDIIPWKISAQMTNGIIYLFKTRMEWTRSDSQFSQLTDRSFSGLKFLHLITDRKDKEINEMEKYFAINCVQLDSHKLLTLNEIDAIDDNQKSIDAKLVERMRTSDDDRYFRKRKLLRFWSKAAVQGMERLFIGNIKSNNVLLDIEVRKVSEIPDFCDQYWSAEECIEFLNRLLDFIKSCVTEENIVFEFTFNRGEEHVFCHRIHPNHSQPILPQFYTQSLQH